MWIYGAYQINNWADLGFNSFSYDIPVEFLFSAVFLSFGVGCLGLATRSENLLMVIVYGELLLVSLVFGLVVVAQCFGDPSGQIYALFVLNAIAVESSIGLVLVLNTFRVCGAIDFTRLKCLRG